MESGLEKSSADGGGGGGSAAFVDSGQPEEQQPQRQLRCCPMVEESECGKCGEPQSLDVGLVEELNLVFERRLRIVEEHGNDSHCRMELYEDWIKQLRLVNLDLVGAVKEMQDTCRKRLELMKANYRKNLARFGTQALQRLETDRNGLVQIIQRASSTGQWDISGIKLCDVTFEQLFGTKEDTECQLQSTKGTSEVPTISVNLEVSSNCQLENPQLEEFQQQLASKDRQIAVLQKMLREHSLTTSISVDENDSDFGIGACSVDDQSELQKLSHNEEKNSDLKIKSSPKENLCPEIKSLKSHIEDGRLSTQSDSDVSQSLTEFEREDSEVLNRKLLQQLQNQLRCKSEQLVKLFKENEELRKEIAELKSKFNQPSNRDNESLINEIKDHHDKNCRLQKKLNDVEQLLREANSAVAHRKKVIEHLRRDNAELQEILTMSQLFFNEYDKRGTGGSNVSFRSESDTTSLGNKERIKKRLSRKETIGDQ